MTRTSCFQVNFESKIFKKPNNFRVFMLKYPELRPVLRVVESNAGIIDLIYSDNNAVFSLVLTPKEVKNLKYETLLFF